MLEWLRLPFDWSTERTYWRRPRRSLLYLYSPTACRLPTILLHRYWYIPVINQALPRIWRRGGNSPTTRLQRELFQLEAELRL
jgi:hypothetical protein